MAKKQKKATPERAPTKHQLSKWQRQMRIRRVVIIAAVVFLAGILSWVGYEYYEDYKSDPLREVVIEVNDASFNMGYFINMLDVYTAGMESDVISDWADQYGGLVADEIIKAELLRQGAKNLNIAVTAAEVDAGLEGAGLPDNEACRDIVRGVLLQVKLEEYFDSPLRLPNTMEQAHVQAMLVESQEIATELIAEIEAGGNFTALAEEFSCNSSIAGDLGWLPQELMPNTLIADAAFNLTPGETIHTIYDDAAIKEVGYWLIEVTGRQDDEVEARAMLLGSEAEAEQVRTELVSGNFSSLAKAYSQHESKDEAGELGLLKRGDMDSEAFDQVAFNITVNEVSEPVKDTSVKTAGGYWLVRVVDRGEHELEGETRKEMVDKRFSDWLEEWKGNSTIENRLNEEKKKFAAEKVLERREATP